MNQIASASNIREQRPRWQVLKAGWETIPTLDRALLYMLLCAAYDLALELRRKESLWRKFRDDAAWADKKKPRKDGQAEALRWVLAYSVGNQKTASLYYRALAAFVARRAPTEELREALEEHGVKKLAGPQPAKPAIASKKSIKSRSVKKASPAGTVSWAAVLEFRQSDFAKFSGENVPIEGIKIAATIDRMGKLGQMTVHKLKFAK